MSFCRLWMKGVVRYVLALLLLMPSVPSRGFNKKTGPQRVVCWNVENLFDCQDDAEKDDEEFLPDSERHWNPRRYWHKLDDVARTIAGASDEYDWPLLVGLCEVENDSVLSDLTRRSPLREARYGYVMTQSPDVRGIDVALLYQPSRFRLLQHYGIRVPSVEHGLSPTRDVLYASGLVPSGDTLHVFVVHLPSKAGHNGNRKHRQLAVRTLSQALDSIGKGNVLVMGDFNTTQNDPLFRQFSPMMHCLTPKGGKQGKHGGGTYFYKSLWEYLDHFLVSDALLSQSQHTSNVLKLLFLLEKDGRPHRTYLGPSYHGGISDHLPIWVDLYKR